MKNLVALIILLAGLDLSLHAQQSFPGYMGKKNTIQVGPSYAPVGFQLYWHAAYHRTISEKSEIGLQYYYSSGDLLSGLHTGRIGTSISNQSYQVNTNNTKAGNVKVEYIGIDFRHCLDSYFAPLGTSIEFGAGRLMVNGLVNSSILAENSTTNQIVNLKASQTFNHLSLGINQKWIIGGANLFIEIGATANYMWTAEFKNENPFASSRSEEEFFATIFRKEFVVENALHTKAAVGIVF